MYTPVSLAATKLVMKLSQWSGRGGAALPGLVAEKIDPSLGRKLASSLPKGVVIVTGTNGKTTSTKMIIDILEASGERVLANRTGSNLRRGVWSALISGFKVAGGTEYTVGVFEIDEANLRLVAADLNPGHIVVTNLFRDQLDRYGELDTTAALIGQGIADTKASLYLNADDPMVAGLARYSTTGDVTYFGVEGLLATMTSSRTVADSDRCPICNTRLKYSRVFYSHIGHYTCPNGDFSRPQPQVAITGVDESDLRGTKAVVSVDGRRADLSLPLPGVYNLYNAVAAMALGIGFGVGMDDILKSLTMTAAAFGRVEEVVIDGKRLYLLLVKNPAGFTQVLETFVLPASTPKVLIAINDNYADGRDVSWLWDVPFEAIGSVQPEIVVSGVRAGDMALRLKYAGVDAAIVPSVGAAIESLVKGMGHEDVAFVLPTYTAMLEVRSALARYTEMKAVKQ
jgi:UDP-N-acetylmuramyl tripeptide synthase